MADPGHARGGIYVIRPPTPRELPACAEIFAAGQGEILPIGAGPSSPADFATAVAGEQLTVAVGVTGTVAGFVSLWVPDRFVHFLHVRAACRGRGLARRLLHHARRQAGGPLELKCLLGNAPALACYHRLGWYEVGRDLDAPLPFARLRQSG